MVKDIKLFPHNEEGYKDTVECLKDNQMVAVNRATGTGKSFILLKLLYNLYRDSNVLYIAPTYQIVDQLMEDHMTSLGLSIDDFKCIDTMICTGILGKDVRKLAEKYDVFVLDEYHRWGAKKWGKQINLLLQILREEYPNKKVIGLTATSIRYLDHEKNMNNILFDGVCASSLYLDDAIVRGILPAATYFNSYYEYLEKLSRHEKRIKKYCIYPGDYEAVKKQLDIYRNKINKIMASSEYRQRLEKINNGKFLLFSSTIKNISEDEEKIKKLFPNKNITFYRVHSGKSKEENRKVLNDFKNQKSGIAVLSSINVLNEGLHVNGVDAIFMFRATTSPIIYFQQIGRLLSFSSRNKDLMIIDDVSNATNNKVIYELYNSVIEKILKLRESDESKREFCDDILRKFKIVDECSELKALDLEITAKYNRDALINRRIQIAMMILNDSNSDFLLREQAYADLSHYAGHIDEDTFLRLKKINDDRLRISLMSFEEFEKFDDIKKSEMIVVNENIEKSNINGLRQRYMNLISKLGEKEVVIQVFKKIKEFLIANRRLPEFNVKDNTGDSIIEKEVYCLEILFHDYFVRYDLLDDLNELKHRIEAINRNSDFDELIKYVEANYGAIPKPGDELYTKYMKVKKELDESSKEKLEQSINNGREQLSTLVQELLDFIKSNLRYPVVISFSPEEASLAKRYTLHKDRFSLYDKKKIKYLVNSYGYGQIDLNTALYVSDIKKKR